jgi:exosome complex protein LRP1
MSVLASETQNKVTSCKTALAAVEKHLEPLFAKSLPEVSRKLAPMENAELQVGLAYTVASLYFSHLLTQGVDPSDHPIRQELDRIQLYFKKLKTTAEDIRDKEAESARLRVDAYAAKRIVQHYTGAADAAAQRQAESSSSSATSPAPQPAEPLGSESDDPPQKKNGKCNPLQILRRKRPFLILRRCQILHLWFRLSLWRRHCLRRKP